MSVRDQDEILLEFGSRVSYPTKYWTQREAITPTIKMSPDTLNLANAKDVRLFCKRSLDDNDTDYLFRKYKDDGDFAFNIDGNANWITVNILGEDTDFYDIAFCILIVNHGENDRRKAIFKVDLARSPE